MPEETIQLKKPEKGKQFNVTFTDSQLRAIREAQEALTLPSVAELVRKAVGALCQEAGVDFPIETSLKRGGAGVNPNSLANLKSIKSAIERGETTAEEVSRKRLESLSLATDKPRRLNPRTVRSVKGELH